MRVRVLGGLSIDGLDARDLGSRKARTLVKVLALARGAPVSVDRIADVLWGEEQPSRPADQVGVLVSRVRRVIGADRLVRTDAGYALRADWLDVEELAARTDEAAAALRAGRLAAARAAAMAAIALARGPLLPEEDGSWLDAARAACDARVGTARRVAAEAAALVGDHLAAVTASEEALAADPYDEASLRILMRAHVAAGRPASALAAYVRVRDRLVEDLGVSPTAETEALHDSIVLDDAAEPASDPSDGARLPGRHEELAILDRGLDALGDGVTSAIVVLGEAGIGKTALVEHWCRSVAGRALTLLGRCDPLDRDLPLQPIADAVTAHLSMLDDDARAAVLGPEATVLGPLLGVETATATTVSDPELGRSRLFSALLAVVGRLAGGRPVALVVDDLHLAGESTLAWLRFVNRRATRVLTIATSRPGTDLRIDVAATMTLGPLDADATAEIVGPSRAAALHARSGGHPLLLVALAGSDDDSLPATVHDAVARRIAGLGEAAATVRTAAVLGRDVDLDLLADVTRAPAVALLGHLEAAASSGLLVERGAGYAFRHELEREALADAAGAARRALVHRDAARALAGRAGPDPLVVAVHARLGGDVDLATSWFTKAAEVAMARHDVPAAEAHLDAALQLADSAAARTARARVRMATGRLDDAARDAAAAVAGGGGAPALEVSGWVAYYRRQNDVAVGFADAALERADDPTLRVSCLALAGRVHHGAGRLGDAADRLERATAEEAPPEVRAVGAVWLGQLRAHQGRPQDALALVDRALVDPDRMTHPFAPLHGWFIRAMALGQIGRAVDALRACDELDAEIARRGEVGARMMAPAANVRAWVLRYTDRPQEADELNLAAVATSDPSSPGAAMSEAYYAGLLDLADGRLLAGDDGGAASLVSRVAPIADWNGTMAWHQRHRWQLLRARLALRDGNRDGALELATAVRADAGARGAGRYELFARAVVALAGGDTTDVPQVVRGLRACAAVDGLPIIQSLLALER